MTEHLDVLIIGAGISGIAAGRYLQTRCPSKRYAILEGRAALGGTWDLFRYPGIRSDSDMFTLGYSFRPWTGEKAIADGPAILDYLRQTAHAFGIDRRIRFQHRVRSASWSSQESRWSIEVEVGPDKRPTRYTCGFLFLCSGYYDYDAGHAPPFPGSEDFQGLLIHPQHWPGDLDYRGKRIVVVGSGATAITLVPALARTAAHVTMLQRSPTYFRTARNAIPLAEELRALGIDEAWIHEIIRRKILHEQVAFTRRTFSEPEKVKEELLGVVREHLGDVVDIEKDFTPRYRPWRQRLPFIPDADLFHAIRSGKVSVATGEIECFTREGVRLKSGEALRADVIITATGFNLSVLGDIDFVIDDAPLDFAGTVTYRGMMFTGVPNMAWVFGYLRASWTLRVDLVAGFVCRLLEHMRAKGLRRVVPALRAEDEGMALGPWIDPENFNPGYVMRSQHLLPKRGDKPMWQHTQDYWTEKDVFPGIDLEGEGLRYA